MAGLLALLPGLLGGGGFTGKFIDHGFDTANQERERENKLKLQKLIGDNNLEKQDMINQNLLERIGIQGKQNKDLQKGGFEQQDKWMNRGIDSFKNAGLPEFSFFDRGGGMNLGRTRDYVGGNSSVNSFGTNLRLPRTGNSTYADMNGLSRPDYSSLGFGQ